MFLLDLLYETLLIKIGEMLVGILKEFRIVKVKNYVEKAEITKNVKEFQLKFQKNSDRNNRLLQIYLKILVLLQKHYQPIMFSNSQSLELQSQNFVFVVSKAFKMVTKGLQFNFKLFTGVS